MAWERRPLIGAAIPIRTVTCQYAAEISDMLRADDQLEKIVLARRPAVGADNDAQRHAAIRLGVYRHRPFDDSRNPAWPLIISRHFSSSAWMRLAVDPPMLLRELEHGLPRLEDLLTGQLRDRVQEQLGEFLPEFRWRQYVAHLLLVRRGRRRRSHGRLHLRLRRWCRDRLYRRNRGLLGDSTRRSRDRLPVGIGLVVHEMDGERLSPAIACHGLESDFHSRNEHARVSIEHRRMQKYILTAIVRRDKSVTARRIEL
jgi:hypothetical protein